MDSDARDAASGRLDVDALRADTPGCHDVVHLNNAGAALQPGPVLRAVTDHLELEGRIGGYEAADRRAGAVEEGRAAVGRLLGADPANVAFTEHATAAFSQALSSIPFREGDLILTTRNDYVSNQLAFLSLERRMGVRVERVPDAPEGGVDARALEGEVHRRRPRLVAVTHVPTNSGLVQPVEDVGRICRERDVLYLVDACQSVGQIPLDVEAIGCDFLSATARKFLRGPRGAGFLFVSDRVLEAGLEPLFPDLRGADWIAPDLYQPAPDATRFETWEFNHALLLGTGEAARYALRTGVEAIGERIRSLAARLRERLADLEGVRVLDRGAELCGIVSVAVEGGPPEELVRDLREEGIHTSAVSLESALLDLEEKGVEGALRISPHAYNTVEETDRLVEALAQRRRA